MSKSEDKPRLLPPNAGQAREDESLRHRPLEFGATRDATGWRITVSFLVPLQFGLRKFMVMMLVATAASVWISSRYQMAATTTDVWTSEIADSLRHIPGATVHRRLISPSSVVISIPRVVYEEACRSQSRFPHQKPTLQEIRAAQAKFDRRILRMVETRYPIEASIVMETGD